MSESNNSWKIALNCGNNLLLIPFETIQLSVEQWSPWECEKVGTWLKKQCSAKKQTYLEDYQISTLSWTLQKLLKSETAWCRKKGWHNEKKMGEDFENDKWGLSVYWAWGDLK